MKHATIFLNEKSVRQTISLDNVKKMFQLYKDKAARTGQQLSWDYAGHTFPYEIKEVQGEKGKILLLISEENNYNLILVGVGTTKGKRFIRITLPNQSLHGDRNKAVEFCKMFGEELNGEVHLFNDRVMYYYPRK